MLNVMLHGLNDHNGIVHHEADSQDESKQRECVDRKTQYWKDDKRSNSETGTASSGISVARQFWRNRNTTTITRPTASSSVLTISFIPSVMGRVVSIATT